LTIEEQVDLERDGEDGWWWPRAMCDVPEESRAVAADYLEANGHQEVSAWLRGSSVEPVYPKLLAAKTSLEQKELTPEISRMLTPP
jgi:hypothetical protein